MNFDITKENALVIFHLGDERLDASNAPELKAELLLLLKKKDAKTLIMDMTGVSFCDSSGLSALLLAEREMRQQNGRVVVVDPLGKIKRLIKISKLESVLPLFPSIAQAKKTIA